jgi:alpha-N-arabinofuranosidase
MVNTHWGGVTEDNSFGTHEFLDLCGQLGCEPYICANVGSGTVQELSQWVEYVNFDGISPMAELRRKNGREEPWKARFWGIGNENWGCGGMMTAEFYADNFRRYAVYARNYGDTGLYKIACGPNQDNYHWTQVLMEKAYGKNSGGLLQALSLHYYTVPGDWLKKGSATEFSEEEWFITMRKAHYMDELVRRHGAIMDEYDPRKEVGLVVDEWGTWYDVEPGTNPGFLYQQNTLRDALVAGLHFNIFNNYAERVRMANIAQTINVLQAVILTQGAEMILTPTYHAFDLYRVHQDAVKLPVFIECEDYSLGRGALPSMSASASVDGEDRVHVSLVNIDPRKERKINLELSGLSAQGVNARILSSENMEDCNTFENPNRVTLRNFNDPVLSRGAGRSLVTLTLPPKSLAVLEIT